MAKSSGNYGWSAFNQSQNSQLNNTNSNGSIKGTLSPARVISIVLDATHPRFLELGGWNALGAIEYDSATNPNYGNIKYPVAYPINSNLKHFPLIQEIVILLSTFSSAVELYEESINILGGENRVYYFNPINIWNHPHHNGYSFDIGGTSSPQNKTYNQTQVGSPKTNSDEPVKIVLGKTFKEKANINPLLPFEGDVIQEGRWGNSIRFGSTIMASASLSPNDWSTSGVGNDGDPITIIRNGQGEIKPNGSEPVIENIKTDLSSIYLTSTQNIPLDASSISYVSYDTDKAPTTPSKYAGAQIILDSGRLVFNAWEDHILLSSAKSINLNSQESVNIDTKKFITQADKIFLGKETLATEPLLLGNTTTQLLKDLTSAVKELANALQFLNSDPVAPNTPATFSSLLIPSTKVLGTLEALQTQLGSSPETCTITSKRNFTL